MKGLKPTAEVFGYPLAPGILGVAPVIVYSIICQRITPFIAIPAPLRIDIALLAAFGGVVLGPRPGLPGEWVRSILFCVSGALLGAATGAPWVAVPWLVVPVLVFAWVGFRRSRPRSRLSLSLVILLLSGLANLGAVSALTARGLRLSPNDFTALDFRVNSLLADVPLHDAWVIDLESDGSATLDDVKEAFTHFSPLHTTPAMLWLSALRRVLGILFEWDADRWDDYDYSFVHRLSEIDRASSTVEPGTRLGMWRVVYAFPDEAVVELINGTVHVAVACAIEEGASGSALYLVFRIREVNWSTRYYMGLIDPFRRYLYYPSLITQFEHIWERENF